MTYLILCRIFILSGKTDEALSKTNITGKNPTETKLHQFGKALAQLHNFSDAYSPLEPFMSYDNFRCDEWGGLAD